MAPAEPFGIQLHCNGLSVMQGRVLSEIRSDNKYYGHI